MAERKRYFFYMSFECNVGFTSEAGYLIPPFTGNVFGAAPLQHSKLLHYLLVHVNNCVNYMALLRTLNFPTFQNPLWYRSKTATRGVSVVSLDIVVYRCGAIPYGIPVNDGHKVNTHLIELY